ncbi:MAG: PDDEXK nuclease domain-containing protein [Elusimicrobiota bacterium]|jgi:predicted nuclease of restriction endonuclease-like (RecB) superfamily
MNKIANPASVSLPKGYRAFLQELKQRILSARIKGALSANRVLLALYWSIGRDIVARQKRDGWGTSVIDRLGQDIQTAFPGIEGFSSRNLWRMRAFYLAYPAEKMPHPVAVLSETVFLPQSVAEMPWGHHALLLEKVKDRTQRLWYAFATLQHGWSRDVLAIQIETRLYERQGTAKKITNFKALLPKPQSDLAEQAIKDPYVFDFLGISQDAQEREIEGQLVKHITQFLLELGAGFAFVGRQVHLEVGEEDFYIDLLFYHLKLRCYVVIELKAGKFKPEYAGQLNFYLSAVDAVLRRSDDHPSIGLILCKDKNHLVAEYALKDVSKPIGISEYRLLRSIPRYLKAGLPTVQELEKELGPGGKR